MAADSDKPSPTPKPRRRWFRPRYSLAALFVVVTAICCWLGYSLNWIEQRRAFITEYRPYAERMPANTANQYDISGRVRSAPGMLWLLGESGVETLYVFVVLEPSAEIAECNAKLDAEVARAKRLFPEATIESRGCVFGAGSDPMPPPPQFPSATD